jgi:predicted TIM-barrel fold metal-dependent hydrolase
MATHAAYMKRFLWILLFAGHGLSLAASSSKEVSGVVDQADQWRLEKRIVDLHQHLDCQSNRLARAVKIMDASGIGLSVNLSGGTVTRPSANEPSEFERNKQQADLLFPGRFLHYFSLDYRHWNDPDFTAQAVRQVEEGHRLGAAGLKEFKRLGLSLRDKAGRLIAVDDPKLDPVWQRCGELSLPVSIHVADPKAFWLPYNEQNERWNELKDHPGWWFGDAQKYPSWKSLLESLDRVVARHPNTRFVCVHFANNAEELDWVDNALSRHPNMMADLAARIPELGRHDPRKVHRLLVKHQDRILFGSDFQVYDRLILGSSGNEPPPSDADAEVFFAKEWRWLETWDRNWPHMTPIQGNWNISAIGLPTSVLRKLYFDNALKMLARALPSPVARARRISSDFALDGTLSHPFWKTATPVFLERQSVDATARPELGTTVRVLWSANHLYLSFACPYTKLTVFESPQSQERFDNARPGTSLWDRDVVEAFIGVNLDQPRHYAEFEVAPTNERLDLMLPGLPARDFAWNSGFESKVKTDPASRKWTCEMRIPLKALNQVPPGVGTRWRLNLYRCDRANQAFLAWNPTLQGSFHQPERFGFLEFVE